MRNNAMRINRIHRSNANINLAGMMYFCDVNKGDLIREWRIYKGMSQEELAARSGIDVSSISQIEAGRRTARIDTVKKIAYGLSIPVTDLSHRPPNDLTRETRIFDLAAWLGDENATFEGRRVSKEDKAVIELIFRVLIDLAHPKLRVK